MVKIFFTLRLFEGASLLLIIQRSTQFVRVNHEELGTANLANQANKRSENPIPLHSLDSPESRCLTLSVAKQFSKYPNLWPSLNLWEDCFKNALADDD